MGVFAFSSLESWFLSSSSSPFLSLAAGLRDGFGKCSLPVGAGIPRESTASTYLALELQDLSAHPQALVSGTACAMVPGSLQGARLGPKLPPSRVAEQICAVSVRPRGSNDSVFVT